MHSYSKGKLNGKKHKALKVYTNQSKNVNWSPFSGVNDGRAVGEDVQDPGQDDQQVVRRSVGQPARVVDGVQPERQSSGI